MPPTGNTMPTTYRMSIPYLLAITLGIGANLPAQAEPSPGTQTRSAITALGHLNGIALACGQMALSTRLRDILINEAPKERDIGEIFEQATHATFLTQGKENASCPNSKSLAERIDTARATMLDALRAGH